MYQLRMEHGTVTADKQLNVKLLCDANDAWSCNKIDWIHFTVEKHLSTEAYCIYLKKKILFNNNISEKQIF